MGSLRKVMKARDKHFSDPDVEYLLKVNPEKISRNLSKAFTRPAYAHTKTEVGGVK